LGSDSTIFLKKIVSCDQVNYAHAGKLKPKTEEKISSGNKKTEDETSDSQVDQIKMKYGYANITNDVSALSSSMQII
jgi:hypothetical protein